MLRSNSLALIYSHEVRRSVRDVHIDALLRKPLRRSLSLPFGLGHFNKCIQPTYLPPLRCGKSAAAAWRKSCRENTLLSVVTKPDGDVVYNHTDAAGVAQLEKIVEFLRRILEAGQCPHDHLIASNGVAANSPKLCLIKIEAKGASRYITSRCTGGQGSGHRGMAWYRSNRALQPTRIHFASATPRLNVGV